MKAKKPSQTVPSFFQKVFVLAVLGAFLTQAVIQLIILKNYYEHVGNSSDSFFMYWITLSAIIIPLLFFTVAYFINPKRKLLKLSTFFENIVIASSGILIFTMLWQIRLQLTSSFRITDGSASTWITHEAVLAVSTLALYALMLLYFRHTKRWKS